MRKRVLQGYGAVHFSNRRTATVLETLCETVCGRYKRHILLDLGKMGSRRNCCRRITFPASHFAQFTHWKAVVFVGHGVIHRSVTNSSVFTSPVVAVVVVGGGGDLCWVWPGSNASPVVSFLAVFPPCRARSSFG